MGTLGEFIRLPVSNGLDSNSRYDRNVSAASVPEFHTQIHLKGCLPTISPVKHEADRQPDETLPGK